MGTLTFQVDLWGCNVTSQTHFDLQSPCIKNLDLKGRVMPVYNHTSSKTVINMSSTDTHTFTENSPFQDSWYYLMIVSSAPIKFDIKITVTGMNSSKIFNINIFTQKL